MKDGTTHLAYKAEHVAALDPVRAAGPTSPSTNKPAQEALAAAVAAAELGVDLAVAQSSGNLNPLLVANVSFLEDSGSRPESDRLIGSRRLER
jgi:hypothetical protein